MGCSSEIEILTVLNRDHPSNAGLKIINPNSRNSERYQKEEMELNKNSIEKCLF